MNRSRLIAIGIMLMFALTTVAQQTAPGGPAKGVSGDSGVPTVETHLKLLTEKLDLTGDQQAKIKPILQEMQDATQKLMQDESLSREDRMGKVRACREKADKKAREILNDDQKKKLDQLESEPHPELHGNVHGLTQPPMRAGLAYFSQKEAGNGAPQGLSFTCFGSFPEVDSKQPQPEPEDAQNTHLDRRTQRRSTPDARRRLASRGHWIPASSG